MPQAPEPSRVECKLAGHTVTFETGRIARQADGAVIARRGDDVVLATIVSSGGRGDLGFFPLTVEYREKLAAVGRIPGNIQRREGRITDHEVLISRLIDRSVRSLFPGTYRDEVQLQVSVLSADPQSDVSTLGILAACAALHVSTIPADGPAAGLRIVQHGTTGAWTPFPSRSERERSALDFVVSAGPAGLVMVEGEGHEVAQDTVVDAMSQALEWTERLRDTFDKLRQQHGAPPKATVAEAVELPTLPETTHAALGEALRIAAKADRNARIDELRQAFIDTLSEDDDVALQTKAFEKARSTIVRQRILDEQVRIDGRSPTDIRPIWCDNSWLPRAHGSAIFTRGETQALVSCTLGTNDDRLRNFGLDGESEDAFILHYNFPPYSVGEVRALRGPGRREIGHGALARRGLAAAVPDFNKFPYTIRVESEISESNGSSSMATVCGGCLAMLDAGVPLTRPVAGIAMGLITDGERTAVLSDILGDEDHLGDMDFKVVGTAKGITALQLDNKIGGLEAKDLETAIQQASAGLRHILGEMAKTLSAPNEEMSTYAPRVFSTSILPESIGALIGPRGANIKAIQADTDARITTDDNGVVHVYAADGQRAKRALQAVGKAAGIVCKGKYYTGVVTKAADFGVFVRINEVNEGLVPRDELQDRSGRAAPDEVVGEGDEIVVRVLGLDERGRLRLSRRAALGIDPAMIEF